MCDVTNNTHFEPRTGLSDLGSKWVRFASNETNLGLFKIIFQYSLAREKSRKQKLKEVIILCDVKTDIFNLEQGRQIWARICQFGTNLALFWPKSDNPNQETKLKI